MNATPAALVEKARRDRIAVVWVQHFDKQLTRGSDEWRIVPELSPRDSEPLVEKTYGDAFEDTSLANVLLTLRVGRLFVAGVETDACIRSTLHGALVRGYDVTLVSDAHTVNDQTSWGAPPPDKVIARFGGSARQMTWLGAALARHGYVAVAVDHPGANSIDGVSDAGAYAPWAQATDLRAALDYALNQPKLAQHIDSDRVGVAGFALGGYASLLAVGARSDFSHFVAFCEGRDRDAMCEKHFEYPLDYRRRAEVLARPGLEALAAEESSDLSDPRIKALFLIAPAFVEALDPASLSRVRTPVGIVLGAADPIAPPATNGRFAARPIPGAKLSVLPGVGHYDFLSECGPGGFKGVAPLCADGTGATRAQTHDVTAAAGIAFFDTALGGG